MSAGDCGGKDRAGVIAIILPIGITEQGQTPAWVFYIFICYNQAKYQAPKIHIKSTSKVPSKGESGDERRGFHCGLLESNYLFSVVEGLAKAISSLYSV